uniref:Hexosyltransferase n=1 Tax=Anopheles epiroticus TaxID=199890 RepID=A0A182P415_9DIPT
MMGWFDKFTLCCVVIVIVSLSVILISMVQLQQRLENDINRTNSELLQKIRALRLGIESSSLHVRKANPAYTFASRNDGPLLAMVIRSAKQSYALRRTIRHTWAQTDHRVVHRFELHGPHIRKKSNPEPLEWLQRLQHHHYANTTITNARYLLFVSETVFVNTPLVLETIERILPRDGFILCKQTISVNSSTQIGTCDASHPILVSMDIVRGSGEKYTVYDGRRLYLNHRETEALVRHQIDEEGQLTYFFTASLLQLNAKMPLTQQIKQLWLSLIGNYTPVEY